VKLTDIKIWAVATPVPHKGGAYWIFVKLTTDNGISGCGEVHGVLSGIEIVCWDIVGKALDQPIYNLMGGKDHEKLRSDTYLYPDVEKLTADNFHGDAGPAHKRFQHDMDLGFTAVGFDPVMPMGSFESRQLSLFHSGLNF